VDNTKIFNIVVLVSGGGSNLQALLDAEKKGIFGYNTAGNNISGKITAVISDRTGIYALERAKLAGIPVIEALPDKNLSVHERRLELSNRILKIAKELKADLLVLAGFLSILSGDIINEYAGRIINLHPALLPKFGGEGMYGERVHRAVLETGEKESGCTVHLVDAGTDTGAIIIQRKVPVLENDTPDFLAQRIHEQEHIAIVEAVKMMIKNLTTEEL